MFSDFVNLADEPDLKTVLCQPISEINTLTRILQTSSFNDGLHYEMSDQAEGHGSRPIYSNVD